MKKLLVLVYGIVAYAAFLCTILYMIGFVGGVLVPKNIDMGIQNSLIETVIIDLALILLFGVSHSVMARPAFKEKLTKFIPHAAERSTFVMVANVSFLILFWQWRPINTPMWSSSSPISELLFGISMVGWVIVFWSTFLIDHFDLFGLRQVWLNFRGVEYSSRPFVLRGLYRFVRHPLMLGFLIAFWFAPAMTLGHFLFAAAMTVYILIGIYYEERDLAKMLGEDYSRYKEQTSMIFPLKWSSKKQ